MEQESIEKKKEDLIKKINRKENDSRSIKEWMLLLSKEVGVYSCGDGYLGKRFYKINYEFIGEDEAKTIVIDNLNALLRNRYFPDANSKEDFDQIKEIISYFTSNLATTLMRISFNSEEDGVSYLPDYCVAFRNGVYDFKKDDWFFKYNVVELPELNNRIYLYDTHYIINWYFDYDFEPLPLSIMSTSFNEFIEIMKESTKEQKNYCFELVYNMSHDEVDKYNENRFEKLCEILGYTILQSFSQYFVFLIGSGQNGKNSLFDGCFTNRLNPLPANNDLITIETDRFITGSLCNKAHNIFLETNGETFRQSKMIKALTGSMYQTIENKGVNRYSGIINCKYVFAGNDRENIKFSDDTIGFRRRINLFDIYYHWDKKKEFLKEGDYYDTTFSQDLRELKRDISNTSVYVYLAMYGIKKATNNFTRSFEFTSIDLKDTYVEGFDLSLKKSISILGSKDYINYAFKNIKESGDMFAYFDNNDHKYKRLKNIDFYGEHNYEDNIKKIKKDIEKEDEIIEGEVISYRKNAYESFCENISYINVKLLQKLSNHDEMTQNRFTALLKKTFAIDKFNYKIYNNQAYVKCSISEKTTRILK